MASNSSYPQGKAWQQAREILHAVVDNPGPAILNTEEKRRDWEESRPEVRVGASYTTGDDTDRSPKEKARSAKKDDLQSSADRLLDQFTDPIETILENSSRVPEGYHPSQDIFTPGTYFTTLGTGKIVKWNEVTGELEDVGMDAYVENVYKPGTSMWIGVGEWDLKRQVEERRRREKQQQQQQQEKGVPFVAKVKKPSTLRYQAYVEDGVEAGVEG